MSCDIEKTLALIKPDVMRLNLVDEILARIVSEGFIIVEKKELQMDETLAQQFYIEHKEKSFFQTLIQFMTSGPILAIVLAAPNAITKWRALIGPTNSIVAKEKAPYSLRGLYGTDGTQNGFHGSDSLASASREISFFFKNQRVGPSPTGEEAMKYIEEKITPTLVQGLTVLCKEKPSNPVEYLCEWLVNNNPNKPVVTKPIVTTEDIKQNRYSTKADIIFVLGGPGSGKGTQCERLADEFNMAHISAGDLLRREVQTGSQTGEMIDKIIREGGLVPMEVTVDLLGKEIEATTKTRVLIDGFPRALDQLKLFEETIKPCHFCIFFDCSAEIMTSRLLKRGQTSGRSDDNIESIKLRFKTYQDQTVPVLKQFETTGKLMKVNANMEIDDVYRYSRNLFV